MVQPGKVQLVVKLPYTMEPRDHPRLKAWLDLGYRIAQLQRTSDHEALVTLASPLPESTSGFERRVQ